MKTSTLVLLELVLVFGGVLGFAFWELYALRRDRRDGADARSESRRADEEG